MRQRCDCDSQWVTDSALEVIIRAIIPNGIVLGQVVYKVHKTGH